MYTYRGQLSDPAHSLDRAATLTLKARLDATANNGGAATHDSDDVGGSEHIGGTDPMARTRREPRMYAHSQPGARVSPLSARVCRTSAHPQKKCAADPRGPRTEFRDGSCAPAGEGAAATTTRTTS